MEARRGRFQQGSIHRVAEYRDGVRRSSRGRNCVVLCDALLAFVQLRARNSNYTQNALLAVMIVSPMSDNPDWIFYCDDPDFTQNTPRRFDCNRVRFANNKPK